MIFCEHAEEFVFGHAVTVKLPVQVMYTLTVHMYLNYEHKRRNCLVSIRRINAKHTCQENNGYKVGDKVLHTV